jgi:hypothetical protein
MNKSPKVGQQQTAEEDITYAAVLTFSSPFDSRARSSSVIHLIKTPETFL